MMLDYNAYSNKMTFPRRENFTEIVSVTSSKGQKKLVNFFDEEEYNKEHKNYSNESDRLFKLFIADLIEYLSIENNPKADLLIAKAIDNNSRGDLRAIADWCEEMVDLIAEI